MLFVILLAGIGAVIFQSMACRLGCVTGLDLATHCRLLLYNRPKYRLLCRYGLLYPLYALCEVAIISTDLAELLGSGIGLVLLFPSMPLWAAMLITAVDVLVFLVIGDPSRGGGRPARIFEWTVMALVVGVIVSFVILLVKIGAQWNEVFLGYVPSAQLFQTSPNAIYAAIGILGATVMPHALFLGSYLATQDRESALPEPIPLPVATSTNRERCTAYLRSLFAVTRSERIAADRQHRSQFVRPDNNTYEFIHAHLGHGIVDIVASLLCIAVPINSAILVIAASVFYDKATPRLKDPNSSAVGLFDAYDLIQQRIGPAPAVIFAIALLCAGQTASITATLAGQIVSEGFIEWRISPVMRRMVTRLLGLIPALAVATALGREGIEVLMVISQVVLSVVLPFVVLPLIYLSSSSHIMSVEKARPSTMATLSISEKFDGNGPEPLPEIVSVRDDVSTPSGATSIYSGEIEEALRTETSRSDTISDDVELPPRQSTFDPVACESRIGTVNLSNGSAVVFFGYLFWILVVVANVYALVELAIGNVSTS
ncbi:Nramp-domain-containing protein [Vararia minispora EC-137]|uniref:Nramp-domain-containing protein n=1 Tax=Vararia minispora EC-137 TaxID=1314806 RepID=A0ACB8QAX1_9AGAM|nr:Nramp-domain-containing protein [Vararia minispora EC-137]